MLLEKVTKIMDKRKYQRASQKMVKTSDLKR